MNNTLVASTTAAKPTITLQDRHGARRAATCGLWGANCKVQVEVLGFSVALSPAIHLWLTEVGVAIVLVDAAPSGFPRLISSI